MSGYVLDQTEYLVLLDALHASSIIGIDSKKLFPVDKKAHKALIFEGIEKLKKRGLLKIENKRHILSIKLLQLAATVARPHIVLSTIRDMPNLGLQLFLHYQAKPGQPVVEQTFPTKQQYRLIALPNFKATVDRILTILAIQATLSTPPFVATMEQRVFLSAKNLAENGQFKAGGNLLIKQGLDANGANQLLTAALYPTFVGTITIMRCQGTHITSKQNITLLQGQQSAWQMQQKKLNSSVIKIETITNQTLKTELHKKYNQLLSLKPIAVN